MSCVQPITPTVPNLGKKRKRELKVMPYAQFLRQPEWYRFRAENLGEKCEKCGSRHRLQLHHKTYKLGRLHPDAVMTLCEHCHKEITQIHRNKPVPVEYATKHIMAGRPKQDFVAVSRQVMATLMVDKKVWESNIYPYLITCKGVSINNVVE